MKRKVIIGILTISMIAGLLSGCGGKKETDTNSIKAGTLTLLNSSEEDYARFQDMSLNMITGIEEGTDPEDAMNTGDSSTDPNAKKTEYVYYDDLNSMIMGLTSGEIEAVQLHSCVGRYICSSNTSLQMKDMYNEATKEETKKAIDAVFSDAFSFLLSDGSSKLRDELDQAIRDMKADGTLDSLVQEYIEGVIAGKEPATISMDTIKGAETIQVAVTGDLPPLDYISNDGTPGGFNTAVLAEIGRRIGKNIELVNIDSGARAVALASGSVDVVFWTRGPVEGIPAEGEPPADSEDPKGLTEAPVDRPELPPDFEESGMAQELEKYKKRDMPENTIVTIPYYTDHYVMVMKK